MSFFYFLWYLVQLWIAIYLFIPVFMLIVYFIKRAFNWQYKIEKKKTVYEREFDFAAIITAHKETRLLFPLVDSLCKQTYEKFYVYVVADSCDISSLQFDDPRVVVLKPEKDLNSKIKSIDYALNHFVRPHDALIIFDSDNLVHPGFMKVMNEYFRKGFRAVQGNLQPKNTDSLYSRLDSVGDVFYNFTEREMRVELGLSSAIWGLGIAIETGLYKEIIYENFLGGFDKRIQADIVRKIPRIAFAPGALVYDEKINDGQSLQTQRTRWINAYFKYLSLGTAVFWNGIKRLNFNVAFFGFINLRPPLFIVLFLAVVFCAVNIINPVYFYGWLILLFLFALSFILIVAVKSKNKQVVRSVIFMPLFALRQILALFKIKRANKAFLKTEHNKVVFIEEILQNEVG